MFNSCLGSLGEHTKNVQTQSSINAKTDNILNPAFKVTDPLDATGNKTNYIFIGRY